MGIVILCAVAVSAMAVPARRGGVVRTAADGTEKTVFLNGDECFHYITDADGNWLDEETLQPLTEEIKNEKLKIKSEAPGRRAQARRVKEETGTDRLLSPRGAVILVSYTDLAFESSNADMTEWAMGDDYKYNGATGSIHQYFLDQSWGQYDLQIDVFGPVTVSHNMKYYGENDAFGDDKRAEDLIKEACVLAHDSCGADFSQYDWDNDGKVDWVVILYAGYGEASGAPSYTVWPHQYELSYNNKAFRLDGKLIDHYCCLNEKDYYSDKREGIGTFCHEFSHVMGLPDFYATNNATHHTLCDWDIMDYGPYLNNGNTPPAYSAYERWFMGWFKPRLINEKCWVVMPELQSSGGACFMTENGDDIENILRPSPTTFYMFENRQKVGWDKYLPGAGLLITKIQWSSSKWSGNTVNNVSSNMGVDIMEALKNSTSGNYAQGKSTDLYPAGAYEFTKIANYQVTNITMSQKIVEFDVNGGGKEVNLGVENVASEDVQCIKLLRDGKVVIIRNGVQYDITGKRIQ